LLIGNYHFAHDYGCVHPGMPLGRKHLRRSRDAPTGGIGHTQRTASRLGGKPSEVNCFDVFPARNVSLEISVSELIPFTKETADVFGRIKGSLKIPTAEAIHLACAATAGTDLFLTNDNNLIGKVIPGVQFIAGLDSNIL
jgi:hypothetical protein